MKIESKNERGYKKIVSFEIDGSELDKYRKISFDKFRKTAKIDGFRPGKVPDSMLRSKFAHGIEAEAVNEAINSSYREFLIENKIYPLTDPVIDNIDKKDDMLTFTATLEVFPEFELKDYAGHTVEQTVSDVTDEDVEDSVKRLLETYASSKETDEPVKKGCIADISIKPANVQNSEWEKQTVEIGLNENEKIDEQIIGMKKSEIRTINLDMSGKSESNMDFEVRIDKISDKILPELNDDFVKRYDPSLNGIDGLKQSVRDRLENNRKANDQREIFDKLAKKIVDAHDNFDVPPSILSKYLDDVVTNAQKQYGKNIEKKMIRNVYRANAELSLKWEYIRHKIIDAENLTVTEDDIRSRFGEISKENSIDIEKVEKYYSPKEKKQMLKDDLLDKKLREKVLEKNSVVYAEPESKSTTQEKQ